MSRSNSRAASSEPRWLSFRRGAFLVANQNGFKRVELPVHLTSEKSTVHLVHEAHARRVGFSTFSEKPGHILLKRSLLSGIRAVPIANDFCGYGGG